MTKQEQDTARARCEAATPGPWEFVDGDNVICSPGIADVCFIPSSSGSDNRDFIIHAPTDISKALDEIDRLKAAFEACAAAHQQNIADRDRWKARAEALGSCLKGDCQFCINTKDDEGNPCFKCHADEHWQFDEARFAKDDAHA